LEVYLNTCSRASQDEDDGYFGIVEVRGFGLGLIIVEVQALGTLVYNGRHYG
jgi:hypothetical protein